MVGEMSEVETASGRRPVRRFSVTGPLDDAAVRDLLARVWTDGAADADAIVLDLSRTTTVDPEALAALFRVKELLGRGLRVETCRDGGPRRPTRRGRLRGDGLGSARG